MIKFLLKPFRQQQNFVLESRTGEPGYLRYKAVDWVDLTQYNSHFEHINFACTRLIAKRTSFVGIHF